MDREAWWATVHGVTKSQTTEHTHTHTHTHAYTYTHYNKGAVETEGGCSQEPYRQHPIIVYIV